MSFLIEGILNIILVWVLLPAVWLVVLPFVALAALFSSHPYFAAVCRYYRQVTRFWLSWGLVTFP
jgi:hypothetical protein